MYTGDMLLKTKLCSSSLQEYDLAPMPRDEIDFHGLQRGVEGNQ
jgi:hypothetical protein